jgi:hypothetical protein
VKVLERLIKPNVVATLPSNKYHHAYKPLCSTVTALLPLATQISINFNDVKPPRHSALVAVDISKAFDSVNHTLFIEEMCATELHPNYKRWISAYLHGRTASCCFNGVISHQYKVKTGFPQGSVLSPNLWNSFVSDCPEPAEINAGYADNLNQLESDPDLLVLDRKLNSSVQKVSDWVLRENLVIAPEKSQVTFFSQDSHQANHHPQVFVDGKLIPLNKNARNLGLLWDPQGCYNAKSMHMVKKYNQQHQILR